MPLRNEQNATEYARVRFFVAAAGERPHRNERSSKRASWTRVRGELGEGEREIAWAKACEPSLAERARTREREKLRTPSEKPDLTYMKDPRTKTG